MNHTRAIRTFFALLIVGTMAGALPKRSYAAESSDIGSGEIVPIPTFQYEDYFTKPHKTPEEDKEMASDNRMPRTVQVLRARNLLAAGHYEEAIADYKEGLPNWKVQLYFRRTAEHEFAVACEKTGKIDDAIKHAKIAGADPILARLYLKEKRFAEAKAIADNNVLDNRIFDFDNHQAADLAPWLQLRAIAECHLKQYENAVRDLKDAARKYYEDNTESADICMRAANELIDRFKLGTPFKLDAVPLAAKGKEKVIELVKFLSTSSDPLKISDVERITGTHIKIPNETWRTIYQEKKDIHPFDRLEYRVNDDDPKVPDLLMLYIATDECCVPKAEIDSLFPSNGTKIPPIDTWSEGESPDAEAWKLPTGRLFLRYGKGGARVLSYIEFNAAKPFEKITTEQLQRRAHWSEKDKKISALTDAIKIDDQMIRLYVDRAHAYCELGQFNEALSDAKRAVALGGQFYLDEQSTVEELMGNLDAAIEHYREFLGERNPGPETAFRYTRLAELYVKGKNYQAALKSADKATVDSKDKSAALFMKAQAEAGLGNIKEARADAQSAAKGYFEKAEIVLRDRVLEWLKSLPAS